MTFAFTVWPAPYSFEHRFHHDIDSPVLALELAHNPSDIGAVVQNGGAGNPDPDKSNKAIRALFLNTVLDCFFIPLYAGYLILFGLTYHPEHFARNVLIGLAIMTAIFDYAENILMFSALAARTPPVYVPSLIKWSLLALVLLMLAKLLLSRHSGPYSIATRRLLALLHIGAALLILLGVVFTEYPWIALGTQLFAFTLLVNVIGLFGPVLALNAMRQVAITDFCEKRRMKPTIGPAIREVPANGSEQSDVQPDSTRRARD